MESWAISVDPLVVLLVVFVVFGLGLDSVRRRPVPRKDEVLVLVTAHPDDEAMFFVPTLKAFMPERVYIICLSTGNVDGLGKTRINEFRTCGTQVFGIPQQNLLVIDHPQLQDGFQHDWDPEVVANVLQQNLKELNDLEGSKKYIVTFDDFGVSGHPNHVATFEGVKFLTRLPEKVERAHFFSLRSVPLLRKYLAIFELALLIPIPSTPDHQHGKKCTFTCSYLSGMSTSYKAMSTHHSQFVWYRRIFIIFSRFTFINDLIPIEY